MGDPAGAAGKFGKNRRYNNSSFIFRNDGTILTINPDTLQSDPSKKSRRTSLAHRR